MARTRSEPTPRRLVLLDRAPGLDGLAPDLANLGSLLAAGDSVEVARLTPGDLVGRGITGGEPISLTHSGVLEPGTRSASARWARTAEPRGATPDSGSGAGPRAERGHPAERTTVATTADTVAELGEDEVAALVATVERGAVLLVVGAIAGRARNDSRRASAAPPPGLGPSAGSAGPSGQPGAARAHLFGLESESPLPVAEWYLHPRSDCAPVWAARLPEEWPVVAEILPLAVPRGWEVTATVNVAFRDQPVVSYRELGAGRVVRVGIGQLAPGPAGGSLARFLQRASSADPVARTSPAETIGVGIVGYGPYGGMGLHHGLACRAVPGLELVAACDPDPARRKSAESDFPGVRTYATAAELAADPGVDVAIVATPPSTHFELVAELLAAGKHVVCEKPLCFRAAEVDRLDQLATDANLLLTVHQNRRFDPDFRAVQRAVASGLVGELFNVETFVGTFAHPCRAWHSEASISGGAIYDWGAHYLDWTLLLMPGEVGTVRANAHKRVWHDVTNHDQVRVHLDFTDGREAEFVHSDVAAIPRPKLYLQGTCGTVAGHYRPVVLERLEPGLGYLATEAHHAEAPAVVTLSRYRPGGGLDTSTLALPAGEPFPFHANLADHLLLGEPVAVDLPSVRRVIAVLEAAQASAEADGAGRTPAGEA